MSISHLSKSLACAAAAFAISNAPVRSDEPREAPGETGSPDRPMVAWLGLAARAVEPVESTQLGLPPGFGLVVEHVFRDGPAAQAGIKHHDILRKFDDQLLINPAQLKTLVCSKNRGDIVKLTYLRSGEEIEVEVPLGEHQVPAVAFRMIRPGDGGEPFPVPADARDQLPVLNLKDLLAGRGIGVGGVHARNLDYDNSAASLSDHTGTYTLTRDGKTVFLRASKAGKQFFEGPVSTPAERAALPAEILGKLETLEAVLGRAKALSDDDLARSEEIIKIPAKKNR